MTEQRKYRDLEIREIFELATTSDADVSALPPSKHDGLTLAELQEVGREVGLAPEQVARAASLLDSRREVLPRGTTFGMPTSVGRVVELPRAVTDHEWDLLVSELRRTFGAKGHVSAHGGLREWTNGNLHAFVEPTETGHQLRMTTFKGDAMAMNAMGGFFMMFALLLVVILLGKDDPGTRFVLPIFFALLGSGALATNVLGLPRWAQKREQQMEYIADRAKTLIASEP